MSAKEAASRDGPARAALNAARVSTRFGRTLGRLRAGERRLRDSAASPSQAIGVDRLRIRHSASAVGSVRKSRPPARTPSRRKAPGVPAGREFGSVRTLVGGVSLDLVIP